MTLEELYRWHRQQEGWCRTAAAFSAADKPEANRGGLLSLAEFHARARRLLLIQGITLTNEETIEVAEMVVDLQIKSCEQLLQPKRSI